MEILQVTTDISNPHYGAGLVPCPVYDWCQGHDPHDLPEDQKLHASKLTTVKIDHPDADRYTSDWGWERFDSPYRGAEICVWFDICGHGIPVDDARAFADQIRAAADEIERQAALMRAEVSA